jgi:putative ATP-binding cassette transporter
MPLSPTPETAVPPTPATPRPWSRIFRITKPIFTSEVRWRAIGWLVLLLGLLLSVTYLNVVNSYVARDFMTAIEERNPARYRQMAMLCLLVFAALTLVAVLVKFSEERLGILWRGWLTALLLDKYLANRNYHRLINRAEIDNPDQRMTEDVKTFTTITLSFLLMLLNATITASAFTVVLWKIDPLLFGVAVGYSLLGSLLTVFVGRKLVGLNNAQLQREANFRYELIHVREYADSIALLRGEKKQRARLGQRLSELVDNFRNIVAVNRNLGFFTEGYKYLLQILPILIVAPRYIRGESSQFGLITQSVQSFAMILGAFSLIVTQFAQISSFAAVVNRLGTIWEVLDEPPEPVASKIEVVYDDARLAYERLTLRRPKDGKVLIADLSVEVPLGRRLLILGPDGIGKSALARATAGIWAQGEGRIVRPSQEKMLFIPQRPYTALGTLRDQFFDADYLGPDADERLIAALCQVAFGPILDRVGGLDVERDWANLLTVGEQQLLGIARLLIARPRFAFLDRATNALSPSRVKHIYDVLAQSPISYVSVGDQAILRDYHDAVLDLQDEGRWTVGPAREPAAA